MAESTSRPGQDGTRRALHNHTERMLQLEREFANRFPERTKADALRTRRGARLQTGQPPIGNRPRFGVPGPGAEMESVTGSAAILGRLAPNRSDPHHRELSHK